MPPEFWWPYATVGTFILVYHRDKIVGVTELRRNKRVENVYTWGGQEIHTIILMENAQCASVDGRIILAKELD
jgi:hypothetical protein